MSSRTPSAVAEALYRTQLWILCLCLEWLKTAGLDVIDRCLCLATCFENSWEFVNLFKCCYHAQGQDLLSKQPAFNDTQDLCPCSLSLLSRKRRSVHEWQRKAGLLVWVEQKQAIDAPVAVPEGLSWDEH